MNEAEYRILRALEARGVKLEGMNAREAVRRAIDLFGISKKVVDACDGPGLSGRVAACADPKFAYGMEFKKSPLLRGMNRTLRFRMRGPAPIQQAARGASKSSANCLDDSSKVRPQ